MTRLRKICINGGLVLGALLVSFFLAELGLRIFSPIEIRIRGDQISLPYFKRYEMTQPGATKIDEHIVHSRNALGFRGPNPPADLDSRLSILAIGGSTTECFYLTDGKTWPELLGQALQPAAPALWLNNAGLSGHSTHGHLVLMDQIVAALRPKVALFLIGINDRAKAEGNRFDKSIDPESAAEQIKLAFLRHSEVLSLLWSIHKTMKATQLGIDGKEIDFAAVTEADAKPEAVEAELASHQPFLAPYAERVRQLVEKSRAAGILPILLTQPAVYGPGTDPTTGLDLGRMAAAPINGATAWQVLELYNDQTRQVAQETGAHLIDLAHLMPKDSAYYRDSIHFSKQGAVVIADILAPRLCAYLKQQFPDQVPGACPAIP